jgi:hypothetical protein
MGPRTGLDDVEKTKFMTLPGLELRVAVPTTVPRLLLNYSAACYSVRMAATLGPAVGCSRLEFAAVSASSLCNEG